MGKIFQIIRKYWILLIIILAAILFITNKLTGTGGPVSNVSTPRPTPTPAGAANYKSIFPGTTTQKDSVKLLGTPIKTVTTGETSIVEYPSTNKYRNNVVYYENGISVLIKEMITSPDDKTVTSIKKEFGTAPYILYDQRPSSVFNLYVYPDSGIAYLGSDNGVLLEVWYFKPMTIGDFVSKWGAGYSNEKTTERAPY